ncbi:MAG: polysaccharide deacetylase family protein [Firmicutes bacterium]|nr:polysaccharide deacetylase family protein [Bacillota bacterium]
MRRSAYFVTGLVCGFISVWIARQLIGTPAAEFFAATGLLTGRLFFPLKQWRQEDLRGAVVGTLLLFAPGLIPPLLGSWFLFYAFTREAVPSSFLGILALVPFTLHYYKSDLLFFYIVVLVCLFLAENLRNSGRQGNSKVADTICYLPRVYHRIRGLRRLINYLLLLAALLLLIASVSLYRVVYSGPEQAPVFNCGKSAQKLVAITFDDGPDPRYTAPILDILKDKNVRATFFVVGTQAERHPELLHRCIEEGHEIGNHTYSHANLYRRNSQKIEKEISWNSAVIEKITGQAPQYFRPPRGLYDERILATCNRLEQRLILWSVSGEDWMEPSARHIVKQVSQKIHPGAIILLHDGGGFLHNYGGNRSNTVNALGQIIDVLQQRGYRLVTISELLDSEMETSQEKS